MKYLVLITEIVTTGANIHNNKKTYSHTLNKKKESFENEKLALHERVFASIVRNNVYYELFCQKPNKD